MRITHISEHAWKLKGDIANALVNFSEHTISVVLIHTDVVRDGKPVVGIAFNSIGRYSQGGILKDRMIPRLLKAESHQLLDDQGVWFDPARVLACAMKNEKPGGHGDRAAAASALELAIWDLNAKLAGEPAYATIARQFGRTVTSTQVPVRAAGGYYYPGDSVGRLKDEMLSYLDMGFDAFKIKIGGASLKEDLIRIDAALAIVGHGSKLAVDANGRFAANTALDYAEAIRPYSLRWYEEIGDPLDFELNWLITGQYDGAVATGKNLFSVQDVRNLVRYGGMRRGLDVFQMDPGLSYGLTEYARMIEELEVHGFRRESAFPHGGHLINLHIVVGLGLGGCETYPGVFQPFGGYSAGCKLGGGFVEPTDAPGFGLEEKPELGQLIAGWLDRA